MCKAVFCLLLLLMTFPAGALAAAPDEEQAVSVPLKGVTLRSFVYAPPPLPPEITPAIKERLFPPAEAANFAAVEERLGGLSEGQKKYLEEHRFLLLPKKEAAFPEAYWSPLFDEMLSNFDSIGGSPLDWERKPENAVLLGPDVFLQALHKYCSQKLKDLEKNELRVSLKTLLANLYANAKTLRGAGENDLAGHWRRLQAQIAVPLILLENGAALEQNHINYELVTLADDSDTLARALELFAPYSEDLGPELTAAVKTELERIYSASESQPSALGLYSASHPGGLIDYTQFKPRGHYETASLSRAWFRAMIWLGQSGWNLETEQGLTDGVNFALAMSYEQAGTSHRAAWQRIMEITAVFAGYPNAPAYPEWQRFLAEHSPAGLTSQSSADTDLMLNLAANLNQIPRPQTPFASLQTENAQYVLTVFPQRFSVPWLIGERLTYDETLRPDLPAALSSLWVPALMGSRFADSLLPKQVWLSLNARPSATPDGAPLAATDTAAASIPTEQGLAATAYLFSLKNHMAALADTLRAEAPESWFSSTGAAWFHMLGSLTAEYGEGFPLYMQDQAFGAKQLESFLGSFTALKHDIVLYEQPNYSEGGGDEGGEIPPVPKGFVEPNLPFWYALSRTLAYMEETFKHYSLYPEDLEEYGSLGRFKSSVNFCTALAEKEMRGRPLSEDEYEAIRTLRLEYMAEPPGGADISREERLSALIADVQTVGADPQLIVYEALAEPYIMLALVANEDSPRVVMGMAYNHREFISPYGKRLTDGEWKKRVYGPEMERNSTFENALPIPPKNFWYDGLRPRRMAGKPGLATHSLRP